MKGWRMTDNRIWTSLIAFASLAMVLAAPGLPERAYAAPADKEIVIVAYGDSLTAGYQLPQMAAFPVQLEKALQAKGHKVRVINAGVSGDTAADGLARFDWTLQDKADAAILELGANDALRGIPVAETRKSLAAILKRFGERRMDVLIAGMEPLRNWGDEYARDFRQMYAALVKENNTLFYPFFLEGVALDATLNLPDGLHPTEKGVGIIVGRMLPQVEALIERVKTRRARES
jgi:acyl-CoA thioesterase-1